MNTGWCSKWSHIKTKAEVRGNDGPSISPQKERQSRKSSARIAKSMMSWRLIVIGQSPNTELRRADLLTYGKYFGAVLVFLAVGLNELVEIFRLKTPNTKRNILSGTSWNMVKTVKADDEGSFVPEEEQWKVLASPWKHIYRWWAAYERYERRLSKRSRGNHVLQDQHLRWMTTEQCNQTTNSHLLSIP